MSEDRIFPISLKGVEAPHVDQYFGVWAMLEKPLETALLRVSGIDLQQHVQAARGRSFADGGYDVIDGVAVIDLGGPLMKQASSLSGGTSTIFARQQIRQAVRDDAIRGIMLRIDSPGGTVAGTHDLASDVAWAAAQKPTHAYIEDLGASAAYWIASQTSRLTAGVTAVVGSIGTYAVLQDLSGYAAKEGIKVHVIRAGEMKGAGTPGTEITPSQLADWQKMVDDMNAHFLKGVSAGRKLPMSRVRELADGRVHIGQAAQDAGLIDGVSTFDKALSALMREAKPQRIKAMSESATPPVAAVVPPVTATIAQLKAACPGAPGDFLLSQIEAGATLAVAQSAWTAKLAADLKAKDDAIAAKDKEIEDLKAKAATTKPSGSKPLKTTPASSSQETTIETETGAAAEFNALVAEKVKAGLSRGKAISSVVRDHADLHQRYIAEANANRRAS